MGFHAVFQTARDLVHCLAPKPVDEVPQLLLGDSGVLGGLNKKNHNQIKESNNATDRCKTNPDPTGLKKTKSGYETVVSKILTFNQKTNPDLASTTSNTEATTTTSTVTASTDMTQLQRDKQYHAQHHHDKYGQDHHG